MQLINKEKKIKYNYNKLFYTSKKNINKMLFFIAEMTIILVTSWISHRIEYNTWLIESQNILFIGISFFLVVLTYIFFVLPNYSKNLSIANDLLVISLSQISIFVILIAQTMIVSSKNRSHYTWIFYWFIDYFTLTFIYRIVIRSLNYLLIKTNKKKEKVVIIGINHPMIKIYRSFKNDFKSRLDLIGYVRTPCDVKASVRVMHYFKCLGSYENIHSIFTKKDISQVWICLPYHENELAAKILKKLDFYQIQIKWIPEIIRFKSLSLSSELIDNLPIININKDKGISDQSKLFIKIIQDKLISLMVLFFLWPVMLIIAIGVKLTSPGPIFYKQSRQGLGGKIFKVIKFRSMHFHAGNEIYPHQAKRNDPRITQFGAFLRRTSLDELPQFFNVLAGSMSIVGPRPHAIEHNNYYRSFINEYNKRHNVKPGITGWAQVNGYRGEISNIWVMKKRLQYDLDYIRKYSLFLDIKIIFLTVIRFYKQETAY